MKKLNSRILVLLLSLAMVLTCLPAQSAFAAGEEDEPFGAETLEMEDLDPSTLNVHKLGEFEEEEPDLSGLTPDTSLNEMVRVSIFLEEPSAFDAGYSTQGIAANPSAVSYRQQLRAGQDRMQTQIEASVGYALDVKWNLTLLANAISTYVYVRDIPLIRKMKGVRSVERENQYTVDDGETAEPNTANTSQFMTGAQAAWTEGYTGAGSRIAIIDTGLDTTHQSFNADAFEHAIAEYEDQFGVTVDLMTSADVPSSGLNGRRNYVSSKIPYAYNYVDKNTTVNHLSDTQGEHGSHVAGIAAANRYIKSGTSYVDAATNVHAVGMAPDAQLLIMKVFGSGGGAYDSDYMAAIEDAIVLEADVANLSLGSGSQGWTYDNSYQTILNSLADGSTNAGMVVSISAGNASSITENLTTDLYIDDVSMHTGGSPGTFTNSLCVASADNTYNTGTPLIFNGSQQVFYTETLGDGSNTAMTSITGSYDYVYIDAVGNTSDYSTVNKALSLSGKVVIVNRGELSFAEKGNNASSYGLKALIVANNAPGSISMDLSDMTTKIPEVSITLADANTIKANSASHTTNGITYYTGRVQVTNTMTTGQVREREDAVVSDFSSWGVPGSLLMKPEITAPGGDIYSVWGTNKTTSGGTAGSSTSYEMMSGTSMAAPHIAGLSAVAAQYLKASGYAALNPALAADYSRRAIIQSLLMSTATPMINNELYVSILQQGSGLADVSAAVAASSVIMMDEAGLTTSTGAAADGKVKAELGDDPERAGVYTYSFTIYNITGQDLAYELSTDIFTQAAYEDSGELFMDMTTVPLDAEVSYVYDNGVTGHDVNQDGVTDDADAQAILDHLTGNMDGSALDLAAADLDGDGGVTTYDAYQLLNYTAPEATGLVVPANSCKQVTVTIVIPESQKAAIEEIYTSGAYIEGFTKVECTTTDAEGVSYAHTHTIPVLAFYGSWTDPSMFDNTSYVDVQYGTEKIPYTGNTETNYMTLKYSGTSTKFSGNPYMVEETFPAERLAVNSTTVTFANIYYNLIRAAGTTGLAVSKTDGLGGDVTSVLAASVAGNDVTGIWYSASEGSWYNLGRKSTTVNKTPGSYGLSEGDTFRIGFYALPEYNGMLFNGDMTSGTAGMLGSAGFKSVIASNVLGDGAFVGYDFTVDNTAPEIVSAALNGNTLSVSASDNMNLAYVAVMSMDGNTKYVEAAPGTASYDISFDAASAIANAAGYVAVFVADYAGNEASRAIKVNDNGSGTDPTAVASISLTPTSLDLYKGDSTDLIAEVLPMTATDRSVTWTSSNTSVASVDETGHVTAVSAGTARITATANGNTSKTATCSVTVTSVNKNLNGIVWDEEGGVYFSRFNTSSLPAWTKLHNDNKGVPFHSAFFQEGTLYACTMDTSTGAATLYTVNTGNYEVTEVETMAAWATDIAPGPTSYAASNGIMVHNYAYLMIVGTVDGPSQGYYGYQDMSATLGEDIYIAGVAAKSLSRTSATYYILDENGIIWQTSLSYSSRTGFSFSTPTKVIETGISTSFLYQSLYYDGTYLYWTHTADSDATLYIINPSNGKIYNAGNFGEGVWPVSGLYVEGSVAPASEGEEPEDGEIPEELQFAGDPMELVTDEIRARYAEEAAGMNGIIYDDEASYGGLNAVAANAPAAQPKVTTRNLVAPVAVPETGAVTVSLTEDTAVTNGLITVTWPEAVTYAGSSSDLPFRSIKVDEAARTIIFAYASQEAVAANTELAQLQFQPARTDQTAAAVVSERGSQTDLAESLEILIPGRVLEPAFKTSSLTLGGQIGVNFYMDLPAIDGVDYSTSYMEFSGNKIESTDAFDANHTNASGYYGFTCDINAVQMAEEITATFHYTDNGVEKTLEHTYAAKDYITYYQQNPEAFNEKTAALIRALADYGHYAQIALAEARGWSIGTDYAEMDTYFTEAEEYDLEAINTAAADYAITANSGGSGIRNMSFSLYLDANTSIYVYFRTAEGYDGIPAVTVNGETASAELQPDGRYRVAVSDISAHLLGTRYQVEVTTDTGTGEINVYAISYVRQVLNSGTGSVNMKYAVAALYEYYIAARNFKNN